MEDWRRRNPGADRRVWNEPHRGRGRKVVWWIGLPLVVGMIAIGGLTTADRHLFTNLPFFGGTALAADATPHPAMPAVVPTAKPTPAPANKRNVSHQH